MGVEACAEALTVRRDAAPSVFTITALKPHKGQGGRRVSSLSGIAKGGRKCSSSMVWAKTAWCIGHHLPDGRKSIFWR